MILVVEGDGCEAEIKGAGVVRSYADKVRSSVFDLFTDAEVSSSAVTSAADRRAAWYHVAGRRLSPLGGARGLRASRRSCKRGGRIKSAMLGMLISIVLNRGLNPASYLRCSQCGTIAGEPDRQFLLRTSTRISREHGAEQGPPEWICPGCGATGPIGSDEMIASDATVRCRRTFLCRHAWQVPAALMQVTCPRCYTRQPGPGTGG